MSPTTREASANAGASRASNNGHYKVVKFHGLKLELPGKVKLRMLKQLTDGTQEEMIAAVEQLLGEEQMEQVWELDVDITKGLEALGDFLGDLAIKVFEAYGPPGKSPASSQR